MRAAAGPSPPQLPPPAAPAAADRGLSPFVAGFSFLTLLAAAFVSCCGLCGVNALFIIVTLVLGGLGLQPMSTDKLGEVGLTLIEDRYQRRANAYAKGALEANFDLVTARCPRSVAADPIILILPDDAGVL